MNDVIIRAAIKAHIECEIDLHNGTLACSEQNSLSGHCQVSSRSPAIILHYKWNIWEVPWESLQTTLCIVKCHSRQFRVHLTVSTSEFHSEQARVPLCKSIPHGRLYDYIIHVALIAIQCASLITSFQPKAIAGKYPVSHLYCVVSVPTFWWQHTITLQL